LSTAILDWARITLWPECSNSRTTC
jgi:hypothetical protein